MIRHSKFGSKNDFKINSETSENLKVKFDESDFFQLKLSFKKGIIYFTSYFLACHSLISHIFQKPTDLDTVTVILFVY